MLLILNLKYVQLWKFIPRPVKHFFIKIDKFNFVIFSDWCFETLRSKKLILLSNSLSIVNFIFWCFELMYLQKASKLSYFWKTRKVSSMYLRYKSGLNSCGHSCSHCSSWWHKNNNDNNGNNNIQLRKMHQCWKEASGTIPNDEWKWMAKEYMGSRLDQRRWRPEDIQGETIKVPDGRITT